MRRTWLIAVGLAGCADSEATPKQDVAVELASITLGEDCGGGGWIPPPPAPAKPAGDTDAKTVRDGGDQLAKRACQQTSMQLSIKASAAASTTIAIKKVELLDAKGKVIEALAARLPTRWDGKRYVTWDQNVAANSSLAASYLLSSPDWNALAKGRRDAQSRTYQVRVTVLVGTQSRTIEKQATAPAMIEPDVDT